jgi:uncharacterized protein YjbI with pentapeptide repeats
MANPEHLEKFKQGSEFWNEWRDEHSDLIPDLSEANLVGQSYADEDGTVHHDIPLGARANLTGYDFSYANLQNACLSDALLHYANLIFSDLSGAFLDGANLERAKMHDSNLRGANLEGANLYRASLYNADLSGAILTGANLARANLSRAILVGAYLVGALLVETNLKNSDLTNCAIYGISAWKSKLEGARQANLIITPPAEPTIVVDNLEVAQFIYLLLNNKNIRGVIDTIGQKGVLLLGRFTPERKTVLDAIRNKLRELGFVPMMFDFEKPTQRDFTETIKTLAGMSRFIIADITNPKSAPLELQAILPHYMIPLVPILQEGEEPFSMFRDLDQKYRQWVLRLLKYDTVDNLVKGMEKAIIKPAQLLAAKLQRVKAEEREARDIKDYL